MAATPSEVKREQVVRLLEQGLGQTAIFAALGPIGFSLSFVKRAIKRWRKEGSVADHKKAGRPRSVRTPQVVKRVREQLRRCKATSSSRVASALNLSRRTMRRILHDDLMLFPYKRRQKQTIPPSGIPKRLQRCKSLRSRHGTEIMVFSDEKKWTIEEKFNPQNHRIWATSIEEAMDDDKYCVTKGQSPAYVMVWAAISNKGKVGLVFLKNEKLTGKKYVRNVLSKHLKPLCNDLLAGCQWTFQQDGAPPHKANTTQRWLEKNVPDFLTRAEWPPYSCDLNPCDYYLWGRMEAQVNTKRFTDVDSLMATIQSAWDTLDEHEVAAACEGFMNRVKLVIQARGGHIHPE